MAKSIIDIDVNSDSFTAFKKLFDEYKANLQDIPGAWDAVSKSLGQSEEAMAAMALALVRERADEREALEAYRQQRLEQQRLLELETKRRQEIHKILEDTVKISKNIASTTLDMFKLVGIGGILSGLAGAGGLWGLDRIAQGASDARRAAGRLGILPSQQQALGIDYGRYEDVNSTLSTLAEQRATLTPAFAALGLDKNEPLAELFIDLQKRAAEMYNQGHNITNDPFVQQFKSLGISLETMRILAGLPPGELGQTEREYRGHEAQLQLSPDDYKKQQDFAVQMAATLQQIKNSLIDVLKPLMPDLVKFSQGLAAFARSAESQHLGEDVKGLGKALGDLSTVGGSLQKNFSFFPWLGSQIRQATDLTRMLKETLIWAANPFGSPNSIQAWKAAQGWAQAASRESLMNGGDGGGPGATGISYGGAPKELSFLPAGALAILSAESQGFNLHAFNPKGGGEGARGIAQLRGPRIRQFRKWEGVDPLDATMDQWADFIKRDLATNYPTLMAEMARASSAAEQADLWAQQYEGIHPGTTGDYERDMATIRAGHRSRPKHPNHGRPPVAAVAVTITHPAGAKVTWNLAQMPQ